MSMLPPPPLRTPVLDADNRFTAPWYRWLVALQDIVDVSGSLPGVAYLADDQTFTGVNTFTGDNVYSGDQTFSGINTFTQRPFINTASPGSAFDVQVAGATYIGLYTAGTRGGYTHWFKGDGALAAVISRTSTSTGAHVRLYDAGSIGTENYTGIKAPATVTTSYDLILPAALPGSNAALQTDSSGNVKFVAQGWYTIASASTITPNLANGWQQKTTVTGNTTVAAPTNSADGDRLLLQFIQNVVGNYTITWNSVYKIPAGAEVIHPDATMRTLCEFVRDGSDWLLLHSTYGV